MTQGKKTGGRKAGTLNKATLEVKEAARQYAPAALNWLYQIMENGESDAAKVSAARELLDRAYGKPTQSIATEQNISVQNKITETDEQIIDRYYYNRLAAEKAVQSSIGKG